MYQVGGKIVPHFCDTAEFVVSSGIEIRFFGFLDQRALPIERAGVDSEI